MSSNDQLSPEEYLNFVKKAYLLIDHEMSSFIDNYPGNQEVLNSYFPDFGVMFEFFRLLRGEGFETVRPTDPDTTKKIYEMEHNLSQKFTQLKEKVNFDDPRYQNSLREMENLFKPQL